MTHSREDTPIYGTRSLLGDQPFRFGCHPGVSCFNRCCHDADMYLYPYDIIRLKRRLGIRSETFLDTYTDTRIRDNPFFPHVMLKMASTEGKPCPFLCAEGCSVYEDRPFSCRAYPLEPAVSRKEGEEKETVYYISRHHYCQGHEESRRQTVARWIAGQGWAPYTAMNIAWVSIDTLLRNNPWGSRGLDSPALKMTFMACYNIDRFREFVFNSSFLTRFSIPEERLAAIRAEDEVLLLFSFDWIKYVLSGSGPLAEMVRAD